MFPHFPHFVLTALSVLSILNQPSYRITSPRGVNYRYNRSNTKYAPVISKALRKEIQEHNARIEAGPRYQDRLMRIQLNRGLNAVIKAQSKNR